VELVRHSGGELNFHDALIATYGREQQISILVSFDRDFDQIKWLTRVSNATEVSNVLRSEKE
jgi:predicted nucleic acid-binding protein